MQSSFCGLSNARINLLYIFTQPPHTAFYFRSYHHVIHGDLSLLVLAFQALIALFFLECCRHLKLVAFQRPPLLTLDDAKRWTCSNLFFCAMLITGMGATKMNTIPVAIVSRNITNFGVILGDYFVFKRRPEAIVLTLCGIMLIGAIVVAWRHSHMHATSVGCLWMTGNCMSTVGYILCLKMATTTNDGVQLSKCGTIFLNNVLCIVLLLPAAYVMGEVSLFLHTPAIHTSVYASQNIFAGFLTFFFNFALLNCVWQKTERKARSFVKKESS